MPAKFRKNKVKPRGVSNRNRGLEWIRSNASEGVLYFADDDNTYDLDIFDEVRIEPKKLCTIMELLLFSHSFSRKSLETIRRKSLKALTCNFIKFHVYLSTIIE